MNEFSEAEKTNMKAARTLIQEKRYADARELLKDIDHPKATDWILQIDRLSPVAPAPKPKMRTLDKWLWAISIIVVVAVIAWVGYSIWSQNANSIEQAHRASCVMTSQSTTELNNCLAGR